MNSLKTTVISVFGLAIAGCATNQHEPVPVSIQQTNNGCVGVNASDSLMALCQDNYNNQVSLEQLFRIGPILFSDPAFEEQKQQFIEIMLRNYAYESNSNNGRTFELIEQYFGFDEETINVMLGIDRETIQNGMPEIDNTLHQILLALKADFTHVEQKEILELFENHILPDRSDDLISDMLLSIQAFYQIDLMQKSSEFELLSLSDIRAAIETQSDTQQTADNTQTGTYQVPGGTTVTIRFFPSQER